MTEHINHVIQLLEVEQNCAGVFSDGCISFENEEVSKIISKAKLTWKHTPSLDGINIDYLYLFSEGKKLLDFSTEKERFQNCLDKLESHKKALKTSKVDFSEICFFDAIPKELLIEWLSIKESAMTSVAKNVKKPESYEVLKKIHILTENISRQTLTVSGVEKKIEYDIFSTATGRLTTTKNSYPILSIKKEDRVNITPKNDLFIELDLNGAEIRTLLSLSGQKQPDYDIHEFNKKLASYENCSRQEIKARFFAWLYNPEAKDYNLEKLYSKDAYKKYYNYDSNQICTPFGRVLNVDERKALNYLTQSTTSDIVLNNGFQIMNILKNRKSYVSFTMHDSIVLDFHREDHSLVEEIKEVFENNSFGKFLSNVSIGKNFGQLRRISI